MTKQKKDKEPPLYVNSNVWKILLEIEDLRVKEHRLIRKLWQDLREDSTRRIHKMVFEQALQSNSAFPSMNKEQLEKWIIENISAVFIALIEQGDLIVEEAEPNRWREAGAAIYDKIKKTVFKDEVSEVNPEETKKNS